MTWRARGIGIVVAAFVATAGLPALRAPADAAPPGDVAAYCRATNPQMQFQVRCLYLEKAAQERVARATPSTERGAFARCQSTSASWSEMEMCLATAPQGAPTTGGAATGPAAGSAPAAGDTRDPTRAPGGGPAGGVASPAPGPPSPTTPGATGPQSPSTVILGPRPSASTASDDKSRPARPISDADAERQLRGVLEREGETAAKCTRKPYGPGWVTVCE